MPPRKRARTGTVSRPPDRTPKPEDSAAAAATTTTPASAAPADDPNYAPRDEPTPSQPGPVQPAVAPVGGSAPAEPEDDLARLNRCWTSDQESALFRAIMRWKPAGLHKHFRMITIAENLRSLGYDAESHPHMRIPAIWAKLRSLYNLGLVDDRDTVDVDFDDDEDVLDPTAAPAEFFLPADQFLHLILARVRADGDGGDGGGAKGARPRPGVFSLPASPPTPPPAKRRTMSRTTKRTAGPADAADDATDDAASPAPAPAVRGGRGGRAGKRGAGMRGGRGGRAVKTEEGHEPSEDGDDDDGSDDGGGGYDDDDDDDDDGKSAVQHKARTRGGPVKGGGGRGRGRRGRARG